MSYISDRYASQGNDWRHRYGLPTVYNMQDQHAYPALTDSWIFPGTWANYKNVKSGNYNRRTCWKCQNAVNTQSPGLYPIHAGPPAAVPQISPEYVKHVNKQYGDYQKARMCNSPGYPSVLGNGCSPSAIDGGAPGFVSKCGSCSGTKGCIPGYSNYHDKVRADLYPKRYVKGWWPDEQQDVTRTPQGVYGDNLGVIDC